MMPVDFSQFKQDNLAFSDIDLEKPALKRLLFLRKGTLYGDFRDDLCKYGLAEEVREIRVPGGKPTPTGKIRITDRGRTYLRYRNKDARRFWIPVLISLLALLLSLCSIAIDVMQLISGLS